MAINSSKETPVYNWESVLPFAVAGTLYLAGRCYRVKGANLGASFVGLGTYIQSKSQVSIDGRPKRRREISWFGTPSLTVFSLAMVGLGVLVTNLSARVSLIAFAVLGTFHLGYAGFKHYAIRSEIQKITKEVEELSNEIDSMTKDNIEQIDRKLEHCSLNYINAIGFIDNIKVFDLYPKFFDKALKLSPNFIKISEASDTWISRLVTLAAILQKNPVPLITEYIELLDKHNYSDLRLFNTLESLKDNSEVTNWMSERGNAIKEKWKEKAK